MIIEIFTKGGDVYPVESDGSFWANQVLDAHWGVLDDEDVSICSFLINADVVKLLFIYVFIFLCYSFSALNPRSVTFRLT